jgi:ABC-2 type transport system permease protein
MGTRLVKLMFLHTRALTLELDRYPAYIVPTIVFPAAFFLLFVGPAGQGDQAVKMATFAGFAAIGVAFFQFGVGIAVDRGSPWEAYLRTLPVGTLTRLGARVLSAVLFAGAAAATLVAVALATTDVDLEPARWVELVLMLLIGSAPFAFFGIALGYWSPQRGALPIANLLYLGLAYAGGLWIRPQDLPPAVEGVSPYLPTRSLSDALTSTVTGRPFEPCACARLACFTVLFAGLAAWGYRRDEGRRFR